MPWIRIQGLKKDDAGRISAGTATIVDTEYVQSTKGAKQHSKQITREKLGRPLALAADRRFGIFRSQEYGIVAYDADTRFFDMMGDDDKRMAFFQAFIRLRRASDPEFGRCCYVDSTPLPNDIEDNPFNAFNSHGDPGIRCRLVLVADIAFDVGCIRSRLMPVKHQG